MSGAKQLSAYVHQGYKAEIWLHAQLTVSARRTVTATDGCGTGGIGVGVGLSVCAGRIGGLRGVLLLLLLSFDRDCEADQYDDACYVVG